MKLFYIIFFIGLTSCVYAQDIVKDSIIIDDLDLYIDDHKTQFNVKFDISNDLINYKLPKEGISFNIKPNLNIKYALVLSYKFASVRLGIRPTLSEEEKENKGNSNSFRIRIQLLFDNWSHLFEYNHDRGYYLVDSNGFDLVDSNGFDQVIQDSNFHIQFPNLTSDVFFGSSFYKFNNNYSVRAIKSQTEIQVKSAGTFFPGVSYTFYQLEGSDKIKISSDKIIFRDNYNDTQGFNISLNAGYYYTFVFHKSWYANAYFVPGVGIDFYKTIIYSPDETLNRSFNDIFYSLQSGIGVGYNGKKIFFGAEYTNRRSSVKFDDSKVQLQVSKDIYHVFLGYRFKAPNTIKKSIDLLEEKVPILNDKNR